MMNNFEEKLLTNEKIIYSTAPHWLIFSQSMVIFALALIFFIYGSRLDANLPSILGVPLNTLATLVVLIFGFLSFMKTYIQYRTSEYKITNKRIIMKTGWANQHSLELFLDKIESIFVTQNLLGGILNYGNIVIVGTGGTQDNFYMLKNPLEFRRNVEQQIELYKTTPPPPSSTPAK